VIADVLNSVIAFTRKFAQAPVTVFHLRLRVSAITLGNTSSNLQLPYEKIRGWLLNCEDDIRVYFSLEVVDVESTVIVAALFPDYWVLFGEQIMHDEVLWWVIDNLFCTEGEGHTTFKGLRIGSQDTLDG